MITLEQAKAVKAKVLKMYEYPLVNGVGITWDENKEYAVSVNFVKEKPDIDLPESIDGVKLVYRFNSGEIRLQ
jgi:hypothetical protein